MKFAWTPHRAACLASLLFLAACLPTLGRNRLMDVDELTHARAALEAAEGGHWMPMTVGGRAWDEKPPLLPWLGAASLACGLPAEAGLRLWPCLAAATALYFLYRLAALLAGGIGGAAACLLFSCQPDFLLHARFFSMDTGLLACYLAAAFFCSRAAQRAGRAENGFEAEVWKAAVCLGLAAATKSWFSLALLPALALAWIFRPARGMSAWGILARLALPPLAVLAAWLAWYARAYGPSFLPREWSGNLAGRLGAPSEMPAPLFYFLWLREGGPDILFFGLPALLSLARFKTAIRDESAAWLKVFLLAFAAFWVAGLLAVRPVINYPLPLAAVACLAAGVWFERASTPSSSLALVACALAGFLSHFGLAPGWISAGLVMAACAVVGLDAAPPEAWPRAGLVKAAAAAVLLAGSGLWAGHYLLHPPDPNRAVVEAVLAHPAQSPGQALYYRGHSTQALEFYSRYRIVPLASPASAPAGQAVLVESGGRVVFRR